MAFVMGRKEGSMPTNRPADEKRVSTLQVLATLALAALLCYGAILFLARVENVVVILIAAVFLAYFIFPVVRWLNRQMPTVMAIVVVYVFIAGLVTVVVNYLLPPLIADTATFVKQIPRLVSEISHDIADPHNKALAWLPATLRDYLANVPQELARIGEQYGFGAAQKAAGYLLSAAAIVAAIIVVPILTAYILLDQENLIRTFLGLFPERQRPKAKAVLLDLDRVLGGFIRGQILDAAVVGVLIYLVLLAFHVPYAYLVAVFSGVFQIVPYLGAIVAFFPAVALALINNGGANAVGVAIAIIVVHQLDGNLIAPKIMRDNVGLSPFWIIVSVLGFTELFGIVGTFVAVPAAAMLRVMKMHFLPDPVEPEEVEPTPEDESLRLGDEIGNVDRK
jgi:predicted PurR-regulated permease PerM